MGFLLFLLVYIAGGVSFLVAAAAVAVFFLTDQVPEVSADLQSRHDAGDNKIFKTTDEKTLQKIKHEPDVAAGYFAVTREFVPGGINGKPPERASPIGIPARPEDGPTSMYQTMVRSIFDRRPAAGTGPKRAGNVFYVVLRHGHLMLYDDVDQLEVRHVISLSHHSVSIYGGGEEVPEGELYIRRNAICLSRSNLAEAPESTLRNASLTKPFFLFSENCSEKEDFYFALLRYQERSPEEDIEPPTPLQYDPAHLIGLVQQLHSSEEHLQTRWLNAVLGRLFLAIYKTPEVGNFFKSKIVKKISRVKKPGFLGDINIQKVDVGEGVPYITNPRLKDLSVDGEMSLEANVSYTGNFRLEVATSAKIDLGARFKMREVGLVLSVCLKSLEGRAVIRIKSPPSNRMWVTFETMPKMELVIEPIVSTRQITFQPILKLIENRIREVIAETVVFPHFDDIPFTDTAGQQFRGGIWVSLKSPTPPTTPPDVSGEEKDIVLDGDSPQSSSASDNTKSMSMPNLQSPPSSIGRNSLLNEKLLQEGNGSPNSGGVRYRGSVGSDRKPKSLRTSSFNSSSARIPIVSTDAINVTAVRDSLEHNRGGGAKSAVQATMERSKSQSGSLSAKSSPVGSPSNHSAISNNSADDAPEVFDETDEFYPAPEEAIIDEIEPLRSRSHSSISASGSVNAATLPSTPPNIYGGSSRSFSNTSLSPMSSRNNSNLTAAFQNSHQNPLNNNPKPALAAVTSAAAAVKKWYKGRGENNNNIPINSNHNNLPHPSMAQDAMQSHLLRNATNSDSPSARATPSLPPAEIPPPIAKKTAPINVPKRKPLPPPMLPNRNKNMEQNQTTTSSSNRRVPPPPLPMRDCDRDEVMVVAAPTLSGSEPTTPQSEVGMMLREEEPSFSSNQALNGGTNTHGKDKQYGIPWQSNEETRKGDKSRRRISRTEEEDVKMSWNKAQEAELRSKVAWYPDEG